MKNRLDSRKRHIAPAIIGAGVGTGVNLLTSILSANTLRKQQDDILKQQWKLRGTQDATALDNYNTNGNTGIDYYAKGGKIDENSLLTSSSMGKYDTKGGELKPISDGVHEVVGNTHGEKSIDNTYGVQLSQNGEPVAEVEDGEVIADNQAVFSDRLKYDNKNSYADMMKKISSKRNSLEEKLESKTTAPQRNGFERKLAGLNMAEDTLFAHQEATKLSEGNKELGKVMAYGGPIKGTIDDDLLTSSLAKKYDESKLLDIQGALDNVTDLNTLQNKSYPYVSKENPLQYPTTTYNPSINPPLTASKLEGNNDINSDTFGDIAGLGIDNVANAFINSASPNVPKPILNSPVRLKTSINVNPQVAAVKNSLKATTDAILTNSSSSNVARASIAKNNIEGAKQLGNIYGQKENIETQLENQNRYAKNQNDIQNNNTVNEYNLLGAQNKAGRLQRTSENFNNIAEDVTQLRQKGATLDEIDNQLLTELQNDPTGQKKREYKKNQYILNRAKQNPLLNSLINN